MKGIGFTILIIFSSIVLSAQNQVVTKKIVVPSWLNIAVAESNQLKGGHHVYDTWSAYAAGMKTGYVEIGMLLTILDPVGDGSGTPVLYHLREWKEKSALPLETEWSDIHTSALFLEDGTSVNNTLRWDGNRWIESNALVNDSIGVSIWGNLKVSGDTIIFGNGEIIDNVIDGRIRVTGDLGTTGSLVFSGPNTLSLSGVATGSDKTITFPDTSGVVALHSDIPQEQGLSISFDGENYIIDLSGSEQDIVLTGGENIKLSESNDTLTITAADQADNLGDHKAIQNIQLDNLFISGDGDDEGVRVNKSGQLVIGNDTVANSGSVLFTDGHKETESKLKLQAPESLSGHQTITFPDASGMLALAIADSTRTFVQDLSGSSAVDVVLNLKTLDKGNNLEIGAGTAIGFSVPASTVQATIGLGDTGSVKGNDLGALTHTAMIAARKTQKGDADLDTKLSFYTRKDGALQERVVITDDGVLEIGQASPASKGIIRLHDANNANAGKIKLQAPDSLSDDQTITFPDASGTIALTSLSNNLVLNDQYLSNDGDDEGIRINDSGHLIIGNDTVNSRGSVQFADGDSISLHRLTVQAPESLSDDRTITFPDANGTVALAIADSTRTFVQDLSSASAVDVVLNLKTLDKGNNLQVGAGTAIGFSIPASVYKSSAGDGDINDVGDNDSGAKVHTAMIAARKTEGIDGDLDTDLAFYTRKDGELSERMVITDEGNLGLGTDTTFNYKLAVNGIIGAKGVQVESTNPWPDYVFEEDYQLLRIDELEKYILENKHLPGVPSALEVQEQGLNLGEMDARLLEKVEELSLYIINLNKQIDDLKKEIRELKKTR